MVFLSSRITCSVLAWCAAAFVGMLQVKLLISTSHANGATWRALVDVLSKVVKHTNPSIV